MYKGHVYRTHFKRDAWHPERFTQVTLYTEEQAQALTEKQRKQLARILPTDIPKLEAMNLQETFI